MAVKDVVSKIIHQLLGSYFFDYLRLLWDFVFVLAILQKPLLHECTSSFLSRVWVLHRTDLGIDLLQVFVFVSISNLNS